MRCTTSFDFGFIALLIYINGIPQAVNSELLLYADQQRDIKAIEEHLNRDFPTLVHWFVDNKLSIHFDEDKTKSILFSPKHRSKPIGHIDSSYKYVRILQYLKVTYLRCVLDEYLTGESMAMQVCTKVTSKLKFLYKKTGSLRKT